MSTNITGKELYAQYPTEYDVNGSSKYVYKCYFNGYSLCTICDLKSCEKLWFGGCYGRGSLSRSKPVFKFQDTKDDSNSTEKLILSPIEVIFLQYVFGCLEVVAENDNSRKFSLQELWRTWVSDSLKLDDINVNQILDRTTEISKYEYLMLGSSCDYKYLIGNILTTDFLLKYATYHYLRGNGHVVRHANKFGCDFLLYKKGPSVDHAFAGVLICPKVYIKYDNGREDPVDNITKRIKYNSWNSFISTVRILNTVKKSARVLFINFKIDQVHVSSVEQCTRHIEGLITNVEYFLDQITHISSIDASRWIPEKTRE